MRSVLYSAFPPLGASLSLEQLQQCGMMLGSAMWTCLPARRRETIQCVRERLGLDHRRAASLAKSSFQHSAQAFLEIFYTRGMDYRFLDGRVEYENRELFDRMCSSSRPVVGVTAHIGSWELTGGVIGEGTAGRGCQVVVRLPKDQDLAQIMMHMRSRPSIIPLPHRDAASLALAYLRQGGISGFLVDHNCQQAEAAFFPFLGKIAAVNKGPAILALRAKAEVWPFFLLRLPHGRFRAVTLPPLDTRDLSGDRQGRIMEICRFYTGVVEQMVLRYPEQWFWMHRRWKTQP